MLFRSDGKFTDISDSPAAEKTVSETDETTEKAKRRLAAALVELRAGATESVADKTTPPNPKEVTPETYRADLQFLFEKQIIASADDWSGKPHFDGQQVATMIVKAASQFAPAATTEQAIAVLQREGIINSASYWKEHATSGQTCNTTSTTRLIQKLAERLRKDRADKE